MTHHHLRLDRRHGLDRNADHDDDGGTADGQGADVEDVAGDDGQQGDDSQVQRAEDDDLVDRLADEVGGRTARTEARNEAAVALHVVGDLNGVVLNGRIEVGEEDDEQEVADGINGAVRGEHVVVHELCHLLEPSHNARFHALMDKYFPRWREARRVMRSKV